MNSENLPGPLPSKSRSGAARPLKRGRACLSCRFLKIKCDGVKPTCGSCLRHPKEDACEYADDPRRSRTKVLEDTVSRLEARLHELENPDSTTPSVTLHDPYNRYHETKRLSKTPPLHIPESAFSPLSPFSPTSTSSSLPSGSSGSSRSPAHLIQPTTTQQPSPFLGAEEPTFLLIQNLLDKFLPHANQFGFFLHTHNFRHSALLAFPFGHHSRPCPSLLSVVYLWGVHLSQSEALMLQENAFLTRAVQHTATELLGSHPQRVIHTLQAEVLLAFYFFRTGRFLDAKRHTGAAVSLALGSQLHKIRSSNISAPSTIGLFSDAPVMLQPPQDYLEEGERINGFWAVFILHKTITVALELPSNVCGALEAPGMQIDTPWPLDVTSYKEGVLDPDVRGNATVRNFLGSFPTAEPHNDDSVAALSVKASILFHRAAHLTGQWTPHMQQREFQAFAAAFQSINRLIETFRAQLPPISHYDPSNPHFRTILMTHSLTNASTIKLHGIFAYADSSSKQNCLAAARNLVDFSSIKLSEVGYMNPIMGTLWMTACHVFIDEVSRVRLLNATWPPVEEGSGATEEELMECLRSGMAALSRFSEDNALMHYQLTKVHEAFSAI